MSSRLGKPDARRVVRRWMAPLMGSGDRSPRPVSGVGERPGYQCRPTRTEGAKGIDGERRKWSRSSVAEFGAARPPPGGPLRIAPALLPLRRRTMRSFLVAFATVSL